MPKQFSYATEMWTAAFLLLQPGVNLLKADTDRPDPLFHLVADRELLDEINAFRSGQATVEPMAFAAKAVELSNMTDRAPADPPAPVA